MLTSLSRLSAVMPFSQGSDMTGSGEGVGACFATFTRWPLVSSQVYSSLSIFNLSLTKYTFFSIVFVGLSTFPKQFALAQGLLGKVILYINF